MRNLLILVLVILLVSPARASSSHVSRKAFVKETNKMLTQYGEELAQYGNTPHPGVDDQAVYFYIYRAMLDFTLIATDMELYKQHKRTQDDVSASLNQLARDMEDVPPSDGR